MLAELSGTVTPGASRGLEELLGLENLDNSEKAVLHDLVSKKRIPGGEPLCRQGDPGDCIFIIESGSAEISINIPGQNRRRRLATLEAGAIFGEMALLDQGMRSANVQALDDIDCYEISREEFERLKNEYPQIALVILERLGRILVSRLRVANETIGELER